MIWICQENKGETEGKINNARKQGGREAGKRGARGLLSQSHRQFLEDPSRKPVT